MISGNTHTNINIYDLYVYTCTRICICIVKKMHIYIYAWFRQCIHIYIYTCIYAYMRIHIYIYVFSIFLACVGSNVTHCSEYNNFHWKCYTLEIHKIEKLRFLSVSRYKFKMSFCFDLNLYRGIWVSRLGVFRGCSILNGSCQKSCWHCVTFRKYHVYV